MNAKLDGTPDKQQNQLEKTSLLILNTFDLATVDHISRLVLLQIREDRYGKKSIISASQLPIVELHEATKENKLAEAIMDHLSPNALRFDLKGDLLWKKKQIEIKYI